MKNILMKLSITIKLLTVFLIAVFSSHAIALATGPVLEITVLSSNLGKESDKFPEELVKFWDEIPIDQDSKTIDIIPKIKLIRIDLVDEKEFVFPKMDSWVDSLVKPDPRIPLKKARDFLKQSKINKDFSAEAAIDSNQKETIKNKYHTEIFKLSCHIKLKYIPNKFGSCIKDAALKTGLFGYEGKLRL